MSHQTGIKASAELQRLFSQSKDGSTRVIQVLIENELLVGGECSQTKGSWEKDYEELLVPMLRGSQTCYALFCLDSRNSLGPEWLFISWTPENSTIRHKMLYAATRTTLKQEFGCSHIKDEISATQLEEVTLSGYRKHLVADAAPAPLTAAERELQQLKIDEVNTEVNVDTKQPTLRGIAFPAQDDVLQALNRLGRKEIGYVQLKLDTEAEVISLVSTQPTDVSELPSRVPSEFPRWHFFLYKHTHEGQQLESLVFIYSMPGSSCSIKDRMLYSSCKGPFLIYAEQHLGLLIARKVEIDDGAELTAEFLYNEVHPKQHTYEPAFRKPPGPTRTRGGGRRIVRTAPDGNEASS